MKAEILDSPSSPSNGEVNYKVPVPSPSARVRHWRMSSIAVSLGALVLVASFVIAAINLRSHASPTNTPKTSAATFADDKRWSSLGYVDIEGGITPLYPLQMGQVKEIVVKENEPVKAGAELFRLDDSVQVIKVRQAAAALKGAQAQLAVAEARVKEADEQIAAQQKAIEDAKLKVDQARIARDQQKRLESGTLADTEAVQNAEILLQRAKNGVQAEQQKLALARAAKRTAEDLVAAAKANIEGKQGLLDEANNAVKQCIVRAPVDGTPLRIFINKGEVLGANPRQPAIQFAAAKPPLVRAEVGQEFAGRVRPNQNVIIEDSVTNEECARGKVASLALWYAPRRTANAEIMAMSSDTRTLECLIHIESTSRTLRIGQCVRVQFPD